MLMIYKELAVFIQEDLVVYPAQGVGKIEALEEQEIGGLAAEFYIIRIFDSNITVMVPVKNAKNVGLRELSTPKQAEEIFTFLEDRSDFTGYTGQNWNRRHREYTEKLNSAALTDVAQVLKELTLISGEKELSFGEKRLLEQAVSLITTELAFVLKEEPEAIKEKITLLFEDILDKQEENNEESA